MVEEGDLRIRRDGRVVEVVEVFKKHDPYWKRDMPYVRLRLFNDPDETTYERTLGTVSSFPPFLP